MQAIYEPRGRAREYAPLALNLYRGCVHGCRYCYAPAATWRPREEFHSASRPRAGVLEALAADVARMQPQRVLLCFTCDPYQPGDSTLTRQAITVLREAGFPVTVLTKGGLRAARDLDLLGPDCEVAVTLTFADRRDSLAWEPLAAPPEERLELLRAARERGIRTWASFEPVIDPDQSLALMRAAAPWLDLAKVGRWNHDQRARAIDWAAFARRAAAELDRLGVECFLKDDLRRALAH